VIASESEAREFVARRCDPRAMDRLERLAAMLTEANTRQNLVSAGSLASVWQRHIADSAQLLDQGPNPWGGPVMDLGSGAGFPGLVLAAMRPETEVRLVESRRLRVEWLANCVAALDLRRCVVEGVRVEALRDAKAAVLCARAR
jgi:16S rRNA (guanine527-N7)-methyltransferase